MLIPKVVHGRHLCVTPVDRLQLHVRSKELTTLSLLSTTGLYAQHSPRVELQGWPHQGEEA